MKKLGASLIIGLLLAFAGGAIAVIQPHPSYAADGGECQLSGGGFLGFPTWYKYLKGQSGIDKNNVSQKDTCQPVLGSINSIYGIIAAVIEILLRIASLVAIGFVVFGGIKYTLSQGAPDKTKEAQSTIINALIGLVIAIIATALVNFVAGGFIEK